jgi:hypothetical protein
LQRQCDQTAKAALRKCVLIGKKPVIGIQSDMRTVLHRLSQNIRSEFASKRSWNGLAKEQPGVAAVAGARPLQSGREIHRTTGFDKCRCILPPCCFVEIRGNEETRLVQQHRVNADGEIPAVAILSGKMTANHFIRNRQKPAMRALRAFDSRLFTHSLNPFIGACGSITGFPSLPALKAAWINIIATAEERSVQRDLVFRGRMTMNLRL